MSSVVCPWQSPVKAVPLPVVRAAFPPASRSVRLQEGRNGNGIDKGGSAWKLFPAVPLRRGGGPGVGIWAPLPKARRSAQAQGGRARAEAPVPAAYKQWDGITEKLTEASTVAFLLLMTPQIVKNGRNLLAGNPAPIGILPWMGYSTGLLGNLLLLSYFAAKKERGATLVQTVGVISTYVLLSQIFLAGFMPPPAFFFTTAVVALGLLLNLLNFRNALSPAVWGVWQDAAGLVGVTVLPQVVFSTFSAKKSSAPGAAAALAGLSFILLTRAGKLPERLRGLWAGLSAWTATLLFMFMPLAQLWACLTNPASLAGISLLTTLLGMVGNGLMVPRALFTRDAIWFTGSAWGTIMMGWAILCSMFVNNVVAPPIFWSVTSLLLLYAAIVFLQDSKAHRARAAAIKYA